MVGFSAATAARSDGERAVYTAVEALVKAPIDKVWAAYTTPEDIKQWNSASDDWHTTKSTVDLRVGGSFASRVTSNIREQKGYTYSPSSQVSRRYHDAYWAEVADVTTAVTGASLKEIFGEIERLQKEAPGAAELQGIQSYLSGLFVIQNSTRGALIGQLRYVDLQGLGENYLKTYVQKVNAVTPADVQTMTAKYIKPEMMTIVVVGDKAKISEQLTPYAATGDSNK